MAALIVTPPHWPSVNRCDIPAVCIDTRAPNLALLAAERMFAAGQSRVVILTDLSGSEIIARHRNNNIETIVIPTISTMHKYCEFLLYELCKFVSDEFIIVFQWDGFIIREQLWNENFLNYDFIGAPWIEEHKSPNGWVGNGGFSLRSRRLLESVTRLAAHVGMTPEDKFIAENADELSRVGGVAIAPIELARQFSIEHETTNGSPHRETFGFHGWFNFHLAFDDWGLVRYISEDMTEVQRRRVLGGWANTALLVNLERAKRYDCLLEVAALTEAALGIALDRSRPSYLQELIDSILAS